MPSRPMALRPYLSTGLPKYTIISLYSTLYYIYRQLEN